MFLANDLQSNFLCEFKTISAACLVAWSALKFECGWLAMKKYISCKQLPIKLSDLTLYMANKKSHLKDSLVSQVELV